MSLISPDALIQANATLMVGAFFLVALRQALKLDVTKEFIGRLSVPIVLFAMSADLLVVGDVLHFVESAMLGSEITFAAGLATLVAALSGVDWQ